MRVRPAMDDDKVVQPFPRASARQSKDAAVAAQFAQAKATERLAAALEEATRVVAPAVHAIHSLSEAQKAFCNFIVGNRLKLALSVPTVLILVGGVSPNAAEVIGRLLKGLGWA